MKKIPLKIAAAVNTLTAFIHLVLGQIDLVNPLSKSDLLISQKAEWTGVWHIVTIVLFFSSYQLIKQAFSKKESDYNLILNWGILYILFGIPFLYSSLVYKTLAPQWILLMPIGMLLLFVVRRKKKVDK